MKILYIHQYFHTPSEPGGTRSYWVARKLIDQGHQVTMITANSKAKKNREEKTIDGINVVYLKEEYNQKMSVFQRLKAFLGFATKSISEARKHKEIDLLIATSTPLTVGITALFMKKIKGVPYVFEVRDLWPEVPIQMGAVKNKILIKALRKFEEKIYKNAEHVVALSPGMQKGVIQYLPKEKTSMIPNMSKIEEFWPRHKDKAYMASLGLSPETFKVIHFGALGLANGAHTIIESAKLLKNDDSVEFIFIGGGSQEPDLQELCRKYGLTNVRFFGRFPMQETSAIVNFCDVSMVSFLDLPILYTNSPNKLFDTLSAGKPIIVNSAGWTKTMVEKHGCGFYVNPHAPHDLVDKIKYMQTHSEEVAQMGQKARELAETKYDKSILCRQFVEVISSLNGADQ